MERVVHSGGIYDFPELDDADAGVASIRFISKLRPLIVKAPMVMPAMLPIIMLGPSSKRWVELLRAAAQSAATSRARQRSLRLRPDADRKDGLAGAHHPLTPIIIEPRS